MRRYRVHFRLMHHDIFLVIRKQASMRAARRVVPDLHLGSSAAQTERGMLFHPTAKEECPCASGLDRRVVAPTPS